MLTLQIFTLAMLVNRIPGEETGLHIAGGEECGDTEFPFMASVFIKDQFKCGSTILSPSWVMTASHCTVDQGLEDIRISYGSAAMNSTDLKSVQVVKVMYPWDEPSKHDLALLKVEPEIELSDHVSTVQLPAMGEETPGGMLALALGWGKTATDGMYPSNLQKVELPVMTEEECQAIFEVGIDEHNMCAGSGESNDGRYVCPGDAGGPLLVNNVQVGLISFDFLTCGEWPIAVSLFTKVSFYVDWIKETLENY